MSSGSPRKFNFSMDHNYQFPIEGLGGAPERQRVAILLDPAPDADSSSHSPRPVSPGLPASPQWRGSGASTFSAARRRTSLQNPTPNLSDTLVVGVQGGGARGSGESSTKYYEVVNPRAGGGIGVRRDSSDTGLMMTRRSLAGTRSQARGSRVQSVSLNSSVVGGNVAAYTHGASADAVCAAGAGASATPMEDAASLAENRARACLIRRQKKKTAAAGAGLRRGSSTLSSTFRVSAAMGNRSDTCEEIVAGDSGLADSVASSHRGSGPATLEQVGVSNAKMAEYLASECGPLSIRSSATDDTQTQAEAAARANAEHLQRRIAELEQRVRELEEENKRLRSLQSVSPPVSRDASTREQSCM